MVMPVVRELAAAAAGRPEWAALADFRLAGPHRQERADCGAEQNCPSLSFGCVCVCDQLYHSAAGAPTFIGLGQQIISRRR